MFECPCNIILNAGDSREQRRPRLQRDSRQRGQVTDNWVEELSAAARRHATDEEHIRADAWIHRLKPPDTQNAKI
jgi:hypothetical protein